MAPDPKNAAVTGTLRAWRVALLAADRVVELHRAGAPESVQEVAVDEATRLLVSGVAAAVILDAAMEAEAGAAAQLAAFERADRSPLN